MKTISFTIIALLIIGLATIIKNKEDKISDLTNSNSFKDKVIAKQDSSLQFYYKVHLTAIELNNIVDSNYSTRKIKKKKKLKNIILKWKQKRK